MLKVKLALHFCSLLIPYMPQGCRWLPCKPLLFFINSFFTESWKRAYTSTSLLNSTNTLLLDYLTDSIKFPKSEAIAVSSRFPPAASLKKPEAIICFFKALGFSDTQIQLSIKRRPSILFADVEQNIKPKVAFFQELGLYGPQLGLMISRNPQLLSSSLEKTLKPSIAVIKEALEFDGSEISNNNFNVLLCCILTRFHPLAFEHSRLRHNITYLRSCGVVGSQLIMLLKVGLGLLSMREAELGNLVSRTTEMGTLIGSRMLVYGILVLYRNNAETINRKLKVLHNFGFSQDECNEMFVKSPYILTKSEAKLRHGIGFFLNTLMLDKSLLVGTPAVLNLSVEKRMIPRYKILEKIKSRSLLEKEPNFITAVKLSEKMFVEKYILRFGDYSKEWQLAYENHLLESSKG